MTDTTGGGDIVRAITFQQEHRCFKKGRTIKVRPGVNLLVGDQGTGKSTILETIRARSAGAPRRGRGKRDPYITALELNPDLDPNKIAVWAFDFEKDNPRTQSHFGEGPGSLEFGFQVASRFASHGETTRQLVLSFANHQDQGLILLDEPDMGLSPRSCHLLVGALNKAAANGSQILAAVHNPIVIASQPHVYSLEHKRWVKSTTFLDAQQFDE